MEANASMEKTTFAEFSAYNRVCEKFLKACEEEKVEVAQAYKAIGRFFNFHLAEEKSSAPAVSKKTERQLTSSEIKEAVSRALAEKAKCLKVSSSEVLLTKDEKNQAIDRLRKELSPKGENPSPSSKGQKETKVSKKAKLVPLSDSDGNSPEKEKKKKDVGAKPEENRKTIVSRIKTARRLVKTTNPTVLEKPVVLNLFAYYNHFFRLKTQWESFKANHNSEGLKNPLRELPDPTREDSACFTCIRKYAVAANVQHHPDTVGTFALQNEQGSFWLGNKPSGICPAPLKENIPEEVLRELSPRN